MTKSILIIRPEAVGQCEKILSELKNRGYHICFMKEYGNWKYYARRIYGEFSEVEFVRYMDEFDKNKFGNKFVLLILECEGDCISKLREDLGDFLDYQIGGKSLRSLFGRSSKYNFNFGRFVFTFPGLHCCDSLKEYEEHLDIFELN